jgi:hypothetical protein
MVVNMAVMIAKLMPFATRTTLAMDVVPNQDCPDAVLERQVQRLDRSPRQ